VEHTRKKAVCSDGGTTSGAGGGDVLELGMLILMGHFRLRSLDFVFGTVGPNLDRLVRKNLLFAIDLHLRYVLDFVLLKTALT
jgi:hypothetical protein